MSEIPSSANVDPMDEFSPVYKPEKDLNDFTLGDRVLNVHRFLSRVDLAPDLPSARHELHYANDALSSLLERLAERYPDFENEIVAAMESEPTFYDYDAIDYLSDLEQDKVTSTRPLDEEGPPTREPPTSQSGVPAGPS